MIVKRKIKRGWAMRVLCMMAVFCISALIVLGNGVTALASSYQEGDIEGTTGLGTKSSPILVDNFGELKEAMEDEDIEYIKVTKNISFQWGDIAEYIENPDAICQEGNKVIQNDYTIFVTSLESSISVVRLSHIINTCGNDLTISGAGTIKGKFNVEEHINHNAVIYGTDGTIILNGNKIEAEVAQVGSYGNAISVGGTAKLVVNSGEFFGSYSYSLATKKNEAIIYKNNSVAPALEVYGNAIFEINDGSFSGGISGDLNKELTLDYFKNKLGVELSGYAIPTGILIKDNATGLISKAKVGAGITVPSGKSVKSFLPEGYGLFSGEGSCYVEPSVSLCEISDATLTAGIQKTISIDLSLSASYEWIITEAGDDQAYPWTTIRKHCKVPEGDESKETISITANDNWLDGKEISCHVKTSHQNVWIKPAKITVVIPKVTSVDVRNIVEPVVGEHPSYTADVKTNVGSFDDYNLDWYKRDADGMHLMKSSDTFESGCRYYVKFYGYSSKYELDVEDDRDSNDYIFNGSIYANGQKYDGTITSNSSHTDMVVSYIWYGYPDGNDINCKCEFVTKEILEPATFDKNGSRLIVCQYCGKTDDATIRNISICELEKTTYVYTGSDIKPSLLIAYIVNGASGTSATELEKEYYDVEYSGKEPGKGTVTITLKGRYSGKKTLDFKIVPQAVKTISVANATTGIKVSWSAVTGATGYQVFRSTDNKNFTRIKSLYNGELTYVDTEANTSGKAYYYKIKAFKKDSDGTEYIGSASASKTTYFLTTPTVTLTNKASGVKVAWGKSAKATGYYVYKSTDGGKTYKNIKTISSNTTVSYTDTAAKTNGTKYMYKVVAYKTVSGTTYKSVASAVKTYYFVSKPAISSATNSAARKMTVKWGKNSKATGYQIQYSLKSDFSSGNKSVTVKSASTVSKVITGLTKGKTYYVRIRTYKTVGSTKYYSAWSAKKSVKITR